MNKFLNKPVESEYFVNKLVETELGIKFLAPLEKHKLLKFISMNKKFDHDLIRYFNCNLTVTVDGLEFYFRKKLVKFSLKDFDTHFGLLEKRCNM